MNDEEIIRNWKIGHSKQWLFQKKYQALQWDKHNNKDSKYKKWYAADLKYEAQKLVEEVLLNWYRKEVSK